MNNIEIRRRILKLLYDAHNRNPHEMIELEELIRELNRKLNLPPHRVQSNVSYLSDPQKSLIQFKNVPGNNGRIYHFVSITAVGIDLLDDPNEFNEKFPSQVIHQHVAGDNLEVTIGDNASQVIVGKDIVKLEFGFDHGLVQICMEFIKLFEAYSVRESDEVSTQIENLQKALQNSEIDLGEIQHIKQKLIALEGKPAVKTTALFSHPAVTNLVQQAVKHLIGDS